MGMLKKNCNPKCSFRILNLTDTEDIWILVRLFSEYLVSVLI